MSRSSNRSGADASAVISAASLSKTRARPVKRPSAIPPSTPASLITALCRQRGITIALMTDARFSGGSVGLVIGHVSPEAALGGPIGLIQDGDTIIVDVNQDTLDCAELDNAATLAERRARWQAEAERNGGTHPLVRPIGTRLLRRMRARALPPLQGAGLSEAGA